MYNWENSLLLLALIKTFCPRACIAVDSMREGWPETVWLLCLSRVLSGFMFHCSFMALRVRRCLLGLLNNASKCKCKMQLRVNASQNPSIHSSLSQFEIECLKIFVDDGIYRIATKNTMEQFNW